ncbi:hypothetical protein RvY_03224 [Ramazzottius varieornatus]|uniref:F-box domain-containing protein n=1 Tax=Ramazzottius varieornatus TaxID=947166 RepID=A0A1D1UR26_RAMVA|nr:hypothetical protein RvY_03224 [Ramazzottius varieornatus]
MPVAALSSVSLTSAKRKDDGADQSGSGQASVKMLKREDAPSLTYVIHNLPKNVKYSKIESFLSPYQARAIDLQKAYGPLRLVQVELATAAEEAWVFAKKDGTKFHLINSQLPRFVFLRSPQQTQADIEQLPAAFAALPDTILFSIFTYFDYLSRVRLSRVCQKWRGELGRGRTAAKRIAYINYTAISKVPTFPKFRISSQLTHLIIRVKSYAAIKALKFSISHHILPAILDEVWLAVKYIRLLNCQLAIGATVTKVSRGGQTTTAGLFEQVTSRRQWKLTIKCSEVLLQATDRSATWMQSLIRYCATANLLWPYGMEQASWLNSCLGQIRKNDPEHMQTIHNHATSDFAGQYGHCPYLLAPAEHNVMLAGRRLNKLDLAMVAGYVQLANKSASVTNGRYLDYAFSKKLLLPPQLMPDTVHFDESFPAHKALAITFKREVNIEA